MSVTRLSFVILVVICGLTGAMTVTAIVRSNWFAVIPWMLLTLFLVAGAINVEERSKPKSL